MYNKTKRPAGPTLSKIGIRLGVLATDYAYAVNGYGNCSAIRSGCLAFRPNLDVQCILEVDKQGTASKFRRRDEDFADL
jgi:hypothetical protein